MDLEMDLLTAHPRSIEVPGAVHVSQPFPMQKVADPDVAVVPIGRKRPLEITTRRLRVAQSGIQLGQAQQGYRILWKLPHHAMKHCDRFLIAAGFDRAAARAPPDLKRTH